MLTFGEVPKEEPVVNFSGVITTSSSDGLNPKKCKIQPKKFFTHSPVVTEVKLSPSPVDSHMENEFQSEILFDTDSSDKESYNEQSANESEELLII